MGQLFRPGIPVCRVLVRCGLLAYIWCILSGGVAINVSCENGWTPSPQSGTCVKFFPKAVTYDKGRQDCLDRGADMVKIVDSVMNAWIMMSVVDGEAYIGLTKLKSQETYRWENDQYEAFFMTMKFPTKPEETDQCLVINLDFYTEEAAWSKLACDCKLPYVCEKYPVIPCPDDWFLNSPAGTCFRVIRVQKSWHDAREYCHYYGGDLAVISDQKVDQFLADQTASVGWRFNKPLWIGLNDVGSRGNYKWLDNSADRVNYANWVGNQPHSRSESNCVAINQTTYQTPYWGDLDCRKRLPFICERLADCKYQRYGMLCPKSCTSPFCVDDQAACNTRNGVCQNVCTTRTHGAVCLKNCSRHCGGFDKACRVRDGTCLSGCEDGFKGDRCDIACGNHTYGANCSQVCSPHCGGQSKTCHHINGSCLFGCAAGYTGLHCEYVKLSPNPDPSYSTTAIVPAACFAIVVLLGFFLIHWVFEIKTGNDPRKSSAIGDEQHMEQDEHMGQYKPMGQDEPMGQVSHMGQNEHTGQDEHMGHNAHTAEDEDIEF